MLDSALVLACAHLPCPNAPAAVWRRDWETNTSTGVTSSASQATPAGSRQLSLSEGSAAPRRESATPPNAKSQAVVAGICQSQSTPLCNAQAAPAASSVA